MDCTSYTCDRALMKTACMGGGVHVVCGHTRLQSTAGAARTGSCISYESEACKNEVRVKHHEHTAEWHGSQ